MMYGCNGYMGHVICNLIKDMENVTAVSYTHLDVYKRQLMPTVKIVI